MKASALRKRHVRRQCDHQTVHVRANGTHCARKSARGRADPVHSTWHTHAATHAPWPEAGARHFTLSTPGLCASSSRPQPRVPNAAPHTHARAHTCQSPRRQWRQPPRSSSSASVLTGERAERSLQAGALFTISEGCKFAASAKTHPLIRSEFGFYYTCRATGIQQSRCNRRLLADGGKAQLYC